MENMMYCIMMDGHMLAAFRHKVEAIEYGVKLMLEGESIHRVFLHFMKVETPYYAMNYCMKWPDVVVRAYEEMHS